MAIKVPYTDREFPTLLSDLRTNLSNAIDGVNDFFESGVGRYMLDAFAGSADSVSFTIDRQAAECYVDTVELRENLISLLKLIGFAPMNPTPESVSVVITRGGDVSSDLPIPKYTRMTATSTRSSIPFVTANQVTIPAGMTSVTVTALQGSWKNLSYTSNGSPYQAYIIPSKNVADGYIRLFVNNFEWLPAEDNTFVGHTPLDTVFRVIPLSDKRIMVELGSGSEGMAAPIGSAVVVSYMDTLHVNGHINSKELRTMAEPGLNNVAVTNANPSVGSTDFETIDSARLRYPRVFKTRMRAVSLDDWEVLARKVPGVMQAKAVDLNIDPSMAYYKIKLYVIGNGGFISDSLNQAVKEYLRLRRMNSNVYTVLSPATVDVDVEGTVAVYRTYSSDDVLANVINTIRDFFEMTNLDDSEIKLGGTVFTSRLITAIQTVPGVSSVEMKKPLEDVPTPFDSFARLNSVSMTVSGVV